MKLYKLCAALSQPVLYPPGKVIFLGPCRLPPCLRALTLALMGAGASPAPLSPPKGGGRAPPALCRLLRRSPPAPRTAPRTLLAAVPAAWRWSPARWPKAAEGPKQCMSVEPCHILYETPSQPRPVWFQVGDRHPAPQLSRSCMTCTLCSLVAQREVEIENHCYFTLKNAF